MMSHVLLLLFALVAIEATDQQQGCCGDGWEHYAPTKKCFKLVFTHGYGFTHPVIKAKCAAMGGRLATIHDRDENAKLAGMAQTPFIKWEPKVGLELIDNMWTWSDGSPLTYSAWEHGQPSCRKEPCNCLYIDYTGIYDPNWRATECYLRSTSFVCEKTCG